MILLGVPRHDETETSMDDLDDLDDLDGYDFAVPYPEMFIFLWGRCANTMYATIYIYIVSTSTDPNYAPPRTCVYL